jgi:hypothetical protein
LCRVIYDDGNFWKHQDSNMPSGNLKMFNRTTIIKLILEAVDVSQKFKDYKAFKRQL